MPLRDSTLIEKTFVRDAKCQLQSELAELARSMFGSVLCWVTGQGALLIKYFSFLFLFEIMGNVTVQDSA